jgi:hypothetical protein
MAIWLHSFISNRKRYMQIESQSHHIIGIFEKIMLSSANADFFQSDDVKSVYFECAEDSTISFYEQKSAEGNTPGIWTYLVYECLEGEEKVFRDSSVDTSIEPLKRLLSGQKLIQRTLDINEYFQYQNYSQKYLDIRLPACWKTSEGERIAYLILEELKALKTSSIFEDGVGEKFKKIVINEFIQAANKVFKRGGKAKDFEEIQFKILQDIQVDDIAKLILESNDYRIWLTALPSRSKAVEYVFNTALKLICQL